MAILLLIVGIGSFGLGRMSAGITGQEQAASVGLSPQVNKVQVAPQTVASGTAAAIATGEPVEKSPQNFVGSKSGTKYHALTCPGAKQIKDTNKIFFATEDEAQSAGYTRAANCK
jgi:hypothetical protein